MDLNMIQKLGENPALLKMVANNIENETFRDMVTEMAKHFTDQTENMDVLEKQAVDAKEQVLAGAEAVSSGNAPEILAKVQAVLTQQRRRKKRTSRKRRSSRKKYKRRKSKRVRVPTRKKKYSRRYVKHLIGT
jgi:ribosomal protein L21